MNQLLLTALVSTAALACSGTRPAPQAPAASSPAPNPADLAVSRPTESGVVRIAEDIRRACGISDSDAHFAFDSAKVRSIDYPTLDRLVACFGSGPLATRQMRLVGHADPRGSEDYNIALGGSRADTVKAFLHERGLGRAQMATTSRGEMDATGTDEGSWAEDRRVDIMLAN